MGFNLQPVALKFNHSQVPLYTESDLLRPKTDAPLGDSKAKPSLRSNASALDDLAFFRSVTILYNLASAQSNLQVLTLYGQRPFFNTNISYLGSI